MSSLFLGPRWVGNLCPMPLPQPLRLFQQCVDNSSDVGEAPSWGPLLFQDVVGLTQGFLGGEGEGLRLSAPLHLLLCTSLLLTEGRVGNTLEELGQRGLTGWPFKV